MNRPFPPPIDWKLRWNERVADLARIYVGQGVGASQIGEEQDCLSFERFIIHQHLLK
jgi:hypothetical protein